MESQILKYIGKRKVWEELSRSAETSSMIQKNQFPERSPLTREQPHCLDCLNWWYGGMWKVDNWIKMAYLCHFGSPGKRKIILIENVDDPKYSLLSFVPQRLLSSTQFSSGKINSKDHHTRKFLFQTGCWHSKQTHTQDKVILSENPDTFFSSPSSTSQH